MSVYHLQSQYASTHFTYLEFILTQHSPHHLSRSPRWLFLHGHEEAASQIVADLNDENIEDPDTQRQIRMIVESINATAMMGDVKFRELFQVRAATLTENRAAAG